MVDAGMVGYFMQKAFRDALSYPAAPSASKSRPTFSAGRPAITPRKSAATCPRASRLPRPARRRPQMVEKAVKMLIDAKNPVVIGGDGIYWSGAEEELKEFIELINSPVHTRRAGRGAVPETHPMSFTGGYRGPILNAADVVCILGLRMSMLEHFGMPPTYPTTARYIQISEDPRRTNYQLPPRSPSRQPEDALQQMIAGSPRRCSRARNRTGRMASFIQDLKAEDAAETQDAIEKGKADKLIHPDFLADPILKDDGPGCDRYPRFLLAMAGFITDKFQANFAHQMLDAATWGGVGQGVGIGMGAQLGRPGKQVIVLLGDGGLGISGWDIETPPVTTSRSATSSSTTRAGFPTSARKKSCRMSSQRRSWSITEEYPLRQDLRGNGRPYRVRDQTGRGRPGLSRALKSGKASLLKLSRTTTLSRPNSSAESSTIRHNLRPKKVSN